MPPSLPVLEKECAQGLGTPPRALEKAVLVSSDHISWSLLFLFSPLSPCSSLLLVSSLSLSPLLLTLPHFCG